MHDIETVARCLLHHGGPMTKMKLNFLLYYIQAWHFVTYDERFMNIKFYGGIHGPLNHNINDAWSVFSLNDVMSAEVYEYDNSLEGEALDSVASIIQAYGQESHITLSRRLYDNWAFLDSRANLESEHASPKDNYISEASMKMFYTFKSQYSAARLEEAFKEAGI